MPFGKQRVLSVRARWGTITNARGRPEPKATEGTVRTKRSVGPGRPRSLSLRCRVSPSGGTEREFYCSPDCNGQTQPGTTGHNQETVGASGRTLRNVRRHQKTGLGEFVNSRSSVRIRPPAPRKTVSRHRSRLATTGTRRRGAAGWRQTGVIHRHVSENYESLPGLASSGTGEKVARVPGTARSVVERDAQQSERWLHHPAHHRRIVVGCHRKQAVPENRRDGPDVHGRVEKQGRG